MSVPAELDFLLCRNILWCPIIGCWTIWWHLEDRQGVHCTVCTLPVHCTVYTVQCALSTVNLQPVCTQGAELLLSAATGDLIRNRALNEDAGMLMREDLNEKGQFSKSDDIIPRCH